LITRCFSFLKILSYKPTTQDSHLILNYRVAFLICKITKGCNGMNINGMEPRSGRVFRENASYVNEANYLAPVPNGDEVITVTEAGIVILTPPNEGNIKALIQPSMQILTRFNDNPTNAIGRLCSAGNKVEC
jgi:hypothetical protein